jgi:hypothetical protein
MFLLDVGNRVATGSLDLLEAFPLSASTPQEVRTPLIGRAWIHEMLQEP